MEPLKESPDVATKILAELVAIDAPISKELLKHWLKKHHGIDNQNTPDLDATLESVLQSDEVQSSEVNGKMAYSIAPSHQASVEKHVGELRTDIMHKIADEGLLMYGNPSSEE